ncbi:unnamed protein product [Eruca vesicaria subsp. sativa]|uniref:Uncharacterized protein n=1 Tax=Eruca vesicaria subsp. sativa TaxID=29727 RepID=A0ABC8M1E4_ERUVS|nr:unnamed protein product [Eruca vesicaria subsp. sativa]
MRYVATVTIRRGLLELGLVKIPGGDSLGVEDVELGVSMRIAIFQWFDLEKSHGWQHLALLEARDIIFEQKEELANLRIQHHFDVALTVLEVNVPSHAPSTQD